MKSSTKHPFILKPATWLGEGTIELSMIEEQLQFMTRWACHPKDKTGRVICIQEIQIKGLPEVMSNQFSLYDFSAKEFKVDLENQALGKVQGKGILKKQLIGWEFRQPEIGFEGFEFYERQEDDTYLMRADYATSNEYRTLIQGKIWLKE